MNNINLYYFCHPCNLTYISAETYQDAVTLVQRTTNFSKSFISEWLLTSAEMQSIDSLYRETDKILEGIEL